MLPFGHLAAGYLVSDAILAAAKPALAPPQLRSLLLWGVFFSFAPDLDFFYAFAKKRSLTITGTDVNHRDYWTHRPMLWLGASLLFAAFAASPYWRWFGVMMLAGSWSHFLLDSIRTGVRWLWPFSRRFFALQAPGAIEANPVKGFFRHWLNMIRMYKEKAPLAFYLEIALVAAAIIKYLTLPSP